jgi:hypothetical protein
VVFFAVPNPLTRDVATPQTLSRSEFVPNREPDDTSNLERLEGQRINKW